MPRRSCRRDLNHDEIADAFRKLGWQWVDSYQFAQYCPGFPDGIAMRHGVTVLIEIKGPRGALTPDEESFLLHCEGNFAICRDVDQVMATHRLYTGQRGLAHTG